MAAQQVVLIERATSTDVLAWCISAAAADRRRIRWHGFNWSTLEATAEVYQVVLPGSRSIEGMIALDVRPGWIEVRLAAVAPWNRGRAGRYQVGGALFAMACWRSFAEGYDGFVAFDAKTALASYYARQYGAQLISERRAPRMVIEEQPAAALVARYIRG
jgi:hypothetical protein